MLSSRVQSINSRSTIRIIIDNISLILASINQGTTSVIGRGDELVELDLRDWLQQKSREQAAVENSYYLMVGELGRKLPALLVRLDEASAVEANVDQPTASERFVKLVGKLANLIRDYRYTNTARSMELTQKAEDLVKAFIHSLGPAHIQFTQLISNYNEALSQVCFDWDRHKMSFNRAHQLSQSQSYGDSPTQVIDTPDTELVRQDSDATEIDNGEYEVASDDGVSSLDIKPSSQSIDQKMIPIERLVRILSYQFPLSQFDVPYERNVARPFIFGVIDVVHQLDRPMSDVLDLSLHIYPRAVRVHPRIFADDFQQQLIAFNDEHHLWRGVKLLPPTPDSLAFQLKLKAVNLRKINSQYVDVFRDLIKGHDPNLVTPQPDKKSDSSTKVRAVSPVSLFNREGSAVSSSSTAKQQVDVSGKKRKRERVAGVFDRPVTRSMTKATEQKASTGPSI